MEQSKPYRFQVPRYVFGLEHLSIEMGGCTCQKSRCLKLYCQCFSSSSLCGKSCKCTDCRNTPSHDAEIETARQGILRRNPGAFRRYRQRVSQFPRPQRVRPRHSEETLAALALTELAVGKPPVTTPAVVTPPRESRNPPHTRRFIPRTLSRPCRRCGAILVPGHGGTGSNCRRCELQQAFVRNHFGGALPIIPTARRVRMQHLFPERRVSLPGVVKADKTVACSKRE